MVHRTIGRGLAIAVLVLRLLGMVMTVIMVITMVVIVMVMAVVMAVIRLDHRFGGCGFDQRIRTRLVAKIDDIHPADGPFLHRIAARGFGLRARLGAAAAVVFLVLRAVVGAPFPEQRLPVRDGDLEVIGVDFGKGQKAVAVAAVIDKGRLQRRLHPCHLGEIDVSGKLPFVHRLEVEFFNLVSVHHHDAGFFRMGGIDQHLFGHGVPMRPAPAVVVPRRVRHRQGKGGLFGRDGDCRAAGSCPMGSPRLSLSSSHASSRFSLEPRCGGSADKSPLASKTWTGKLTTLRPIRLPRHGTKNARPDRGQRIPLRIETRTLRP